MKHELLKDDDENQNQSSSSSLSKYHMFLEWELSILFSSKSAISHFISSSIPSLLDHKKQQKRRSTSLNLPSSHSSPLHSEKLSKYNQFHEIIQNIIHSSSSYYEEEEEENHPPPPIDSFNLLSLYSNQRNDISSLLSSHFHHIEQQNNNCDQMKEQEQEMDDDRFISPSTISPSNSSYHISIDSLSNKQRSHLMISSKEKEEKDQKDEKEEMKTSTNQHHTMEEDEIMDAEKVVEDPFQPSPLPYLRKDSSTNSSNSNNSLQQHHLPPIIPNTPSPSLGFIFISHQIYLISCLSFFVVRKSTKNKKFNKESF